MTGTATPWDGDGAGVFSEELAWANELASRRIGPYRIEGLLGEGGMGSVYLAEQEEPVHRRVALKVVSRLSREDHRKRFAAECQALARLQHPNVAGLLEVGATDSGVPYVAMEYVRGEAILDWANQRRLGVEERLRLFFGVCAGARHAHEKGILHRDLKPSNILVAEVDGVPVAKIIDFGIAHALDEPLLVHTRMPEESLVGSPGYMSPESLDGVECMDTRSDVYSLGVVLYELMVGVVPVERGGRSVFALMEELAQKPVPSPVTRFFGLSEAKREELAAARGVSISSLAEWLRGDLSAIIGKATALEPTRRYSSPAELAADLSRLLRHQPVEARPASTFYLLRLFLRRRLGTVAAIGALILALTAGVIARSMEATRAQRALVEAEEVSRFMIELFQVSNPERMADKPSTIPEVLDQGAVRLLSGEALTDQPLARARLLHTIASIQSRQGRPEPALSACRAGLQIRRDILGYDHDETLTSLNLLGSIQRVLGDLAAAEESLAQVVDRRRASAWSRDDFLSLASALNNLGNLVKDQERFSEAQELHLEALSLREAHLRMGDNGYFDLGESLNNLAISYWEAGDLEKAGPFLHRSAEVFRGMGESHPRYVTTVYNLGLVKRSQGHIEEALEIFETAEMGWRDAYGGSHRLTLKAMSARAGGLARLGRWREAVDIRVHLLEQARQEAHRAGQDWTSELCKQLENLGRSLVESRDFEAAESILVELDQCSGKVWGDDHRKAGLSDYFRLRRQELEQEPDRVQEEATRLLNTVDLGGQARGAVLLVRIDAWIALERYEQALAELERILGMAEGLKFSVRAEGRIWLAKARSEKALGRSIESRASAQAALDLMLPQFGIEHPYVAEARDFLATLVEPNV